MLQKYISISLEKAEFALCGQYARDVIEGLLEVAESKPDLLPPILPIVDSILDKRKVPAIRTAISELICFPDTFSDAKEIHEELCGTRTLKEELDQFLTRAKSRNQRQAEASLNRLYSKVANVQAEELKKIENST